MAEPLTPRAESCDCTCSTLGPGPHDAVARHPIARSCRHDDVAATREFRFTTWTGSTFVVTVDETDPGDMGEPRSVVADGVAYLSVAASR